MKKSGFAGHWADGWRKPPSGWKGRELTTYQF
jgi:hypothetical protein